MIEHLPEWLETGIAIVGVGIAIFKQFQLDRLVPRKVRKLFNNPTVKMIIAHLIGVQASEEDKRNMAKQSIDAFLRDHGIILKEKQLNLLVELTYNAIQRKAN